jgi:hypothetical protein
VFGVDDGRRRLGREHACARGPQLLSRDPGQQVGRKGEKRLVETGPARVGVRGSVTHALELARRLLERLALQQAGEEKVALLPEPELLVEVDVITAWEQAPRLELHQDGGDQEELGGHLQVEGLHALELEDVGVDDGRDADLVDVHLLLGDEVEQEVEGALEHGRGHLVGHAARLPGGARGAGAYHRRP